MKHFKTTTAPGLFDVEFRLQWLLAKGNPLSRLVAVINWERFRPLLDAALDKPAQGPGGRPAHDRLKMFKALVVQRFYNLSDEQTEPVCRQARYQINDRLSFQQFIGWTLADKIPNANTLWDFREALIEAGAFEKLFALFQSGRHADGVGRTTCETTAEGRGCALDQEQRRAALRLQSCLSADREPRQGGCEKQAHRVLCGDRCQRP